MATTSRFSDLPQEIKLEIARYVTIPVTTRHPVSWGYLNIPDLDSSLRAVNRDTRRLFCDVVSKDYLHLRISPCDCPKRRLKPRLFPQLIEQLQLNRRSPDISVYERTLGLKLSVLEMEILCSSDCVGKQAQVKTFLATRDTMLTLHAILQELAPMPASLRIRTRCKSPRSIAQAVRVLDEMRSLIYETEVRPDSRLLIGYDLNAFCANMARRLNTPRDMIRLQESHLYAIQDAIDNGTFLEQLVPSLILYEHGTIRQEVMEPIALWDIADWKKTRKYLFSFEMTYDCAVLQGIAGYLLSRKLTHEEQYHFFMAPDYWPSKLEYVLAEVDSSIRHYQDFEVYVPDNIPVTMGWMAPIYKARVEFLLAWARRNTLATYSRYSISGHMYPDSLPSYNLDVDYLGDNEYEDFDYSTWGTPKTMVLVARRDMKKLSTWIRDATRGVEHESTEGVHPMDLEANMIWMWRMQDLADAIDNAQPKKGYDPTMGRRLLHDEMIEEEGLCKKLMYLPDRTGRRVLHAELEEENWEV